MEEQTSQMEVIVASLINYEEQKGKENLNTQNNEDFFKVQSLYKNKRKQNSERKRGKLSRRKVCDKTNKKKFANV